MKRAAEPPALNLPAGARLVALRSPSPDRGADPAALPGRVLGLKWGENKTTQGTIIVGARTLSVLPLLQAEAGFDHVAIDFGHNSVPGSPTYRGEPVKLAASRSTPRVIEGVGLVYDAPEWTDEGREHAAHYPDVSATVLLDAENHVIFTHSCALVRNGAAEGMTLFPVPAGSGLAETLVALAASPVLHPEPKTTKTMDKTKLNLVALLAALDLNESATEEDINGALEQLTAAKEAARADGEKKKAMAATPPADGSLVALTARIEGLQQQLALLTARQEDAERAAIVAQAVSQGKVVPKVVHEGPRALSPSDLRTYCAELPSIVPLAGRSGSETAKLTILAADQPLTPEQRETCRQLGISEEKFRNPTAKPAKTA